MSYRIGSFNCLNLGLGAAKDIDKLVEIITKEQFDIVALQEIKGQTALRKRILNNHNMPKNWTGRADDGYVNDYAFIWNQDRIQLAYTESGSTKRTSEPHIYKQYRIDRYQGQQDLVREPYYARFIPVGAGAPFIEIRIINCHIRYSKGKTGSSADDQSLGAIAMRKNEFNVLSSALYPRIADKRYGNNRPAYTIMLGDYNLNTPSSCAGTPYLLESFEIVEGQNVKRIVTAQHERTTLKNPNSQFGQSHGFANNYDHFTYDGERFDSISVQCYSIDSVRKYCNGDFEAHRKNVSDHIPVVMELDLLKG